MNTCPICSSEVNKNNLCKVSFTYNTEFDLSECSGCSVIYCNPIPTTKQFIDFYSTEGYEYNRWKQESKAKSYIKKLNKKQKNGKFLDIGCATGYMINKIDQDSDWEVYGVELSRKPAEFASEYLKLKNIIHGDLFSANYSANYFDCINISDVLEHVPNPAEFLAECHRILKPDGHILLGVPNGYNDSRGLIRYYKQFNKAGCHASGHVYFFQKQTFEHMFEQIGLEIVKSETIGIKNGLRNIGVLPRKRSWAKFFNPRVTAEVAIDSDIKPITEKKYPEIYYTYRYAKHSWFTLPGLYNFGLAFNFVLTPTKTSK